MQFSVPRPGSKCCKIGNMTFWKKHKKTTFQATMRVCRLKAADPLTDLFIQVHMLSLDDWSYVWSLVATRARHGDGCFDWSGQRIFTNPSAPERWPQGQAAGRSGGLGVCAGDFRRAAGLVVKGTVIASDEIWDDLKFAIVGYWRYPHFQRCLDKNLGGLAETQ